ncbi:hypothetical protein [Soonwooa sp.]|nr:hypothetical protein [Soonwooa sp.]
MYTSGDSIAVDLEGDVCQVDFYKSLNYYTKLIVDVPVKVIYRFKS